MSVRAILSGPVFVSCSGRVECRKYSTRSHGSIHTKEE